jgi:hypothetical protein
MERSFHPLPSIELQKILSRASQSRIAVIGDFCLDAYWFLDPSNDERSLETGLPVRRVHQQRYSPGGAGNVLMNLRTLGVSDVLAFGVLGPDPFGPALKGLLDDAGVATQGLLTQTQGWGTHVYGKPYAASTTPPPARSSPRSATACPDWMPSSSTNRSREASTLRRHSPMLCAN